MPLPELGLFLVRSRPSYTEKQGGHAPSDPERTDIVIIFSDPTRAHKPLDGDNGNLRSAVSLRNIRMPDRIGSVGGRWMPTTGFAEAGALQMAAPLLAFGLKPSSSSRKSHLWAPSAAGSTQVRGC
ncbi:MAG: hypothetical protein QOJ06_183 [Pseudonocardiales bacterium]|nr:hypothetical protein [Pseudonocardiales bacterium]